VIPSALSWATGRVMMGRHKANQRQLFYLSNLEARIPAHHLLRRINPIVSRVPAGTAPSDT